MISQFLKLGFFHFCKVNILKGGMAFQISFSVNYLFMSFGFFKKDIHDFLQTLKKTFAY